MKALVTGGGGFLGSAIVRRLLERGDEVAIFNRGSYPALEAIGARPLTGDLADRNRVADACEGVETVFHVGAKAGIWGKWDDYYGANVRGTENVIAGCLKHGVKKLIYTSSPSVVCGEEYDAGADESAPYPDRYLCYYSWTKAIAEKMVLSANGKSGLLTVALRPHLIWGPGDNHLIPRVIASAKKGRLAIVGNGKNRVDVTYIDNAAEAHILAEKALAPGAPCAGSSYFITQGEPVHLWDFINEILEGTGVPKVSRRISYEMACTIGHALEIAYAVFGLSGEPRMTRFLAAQLSTDHYFDISRARRDLKYEAKVSTAAGLKLLIEDLNARGR